MHSDTRRSGTLAAIAAGGLLLVACGIPAAPAAAVPTVAVDQIGANSPAAPTAAAARPGVDHGERGPGGVQHVEDDRLEIDIGTTVGR